MTLDHDMPPHHATHPKCETAARPFPLSYLPIAADQVAAWRAGATDAYGMPPERAVCDGFGAPCRACLKNIPEGREMLILAHRPFAALGPYAETGPIFLCADACEPHDPAIPATEIARVNKMLVKGYLANDRIHYGTGRIVHPDDLEAACAQLLADPRNAYLHVRSATNNCYLFRVERI